MCGEEERACRVDVQGGGGRRCCASGPRTDVACCVHRYCMIDDPSTCSISHDIADGCSIAQFLLSLARASMRKSVQPSVHDRSLLLRSLPDPSSLPLGPDGVYPGYRVLGTVERLYMMGSMMFGMSGCDFLRLTFSKAELDAIKAKAMEPLQGEWERGITCMPCHTAVVIEMPYCPCCSLLAGTEQFVSSSNALAAHLWPLLSEITNGGVMPAKLLPYHTAINWRRALGLPENYFGNCATFRAAEEASADEGLTELAIKVRRDEINLPHRGACAVDDHDLLPCFNHRCERRARAPRAWSRSWRGCRASWPRARSAPSCSRRW